VGGNVASGVTGSLDATAIALLLPLFRLWIESNMLPLFEKAIRAEMDNANKESGK
jgi:cell pole-organizing protein PopZ